MCGIAGIIAQKSIGRLLYECLVAQKNRGQDTSGIILFSKGQAPFIIKKLEEISNWSEEDLRELERSKGTLGIGHVRYPTTDKITEERAAQPFYDELSGIALAHNGQIVNEKEIKAYLQQQYILCTTDCDAEPLQKYFAYKFLQKEGNLEEKLFSTVAEVMENVKGAYSVVAAIRNSGLLAFKDPYGIRPLVYGKSEDGVAFASETLALEMIGYKVVRDLKPGEVIFVGVDGTIIEKVIKAKGSAPCSFEYVYFSRAPSKILGIGVNAVRRRLGEELAKEIRKKGFKFDKERTLVASVPKTAAPAAEALAYKLNLKYSSVLEKISEKRIFIQSKEKREEDVKNLVLNDDVTGKVILLVDDSIVRGTNSKYVVNLLKKAGASEIYFFSTFPPIRYPCQYGIDFRTKDQLIASNKTIDEIKTEIGVDYLQYMTIEGLKRAIGLETLCTACVDGKYPSN